MARIGEWIRRLGYLLRRGHHEEELRREMEAHRAQMAHPAAFGNALRLREEAHDTHLSASLEMWMFRAGARVFSVFAAIALVLAVVGVYGVTSYIVSRRTREFGIRIATGADPRALLWQVLYEGSRVTAIGIAIGLVLALGAGRLLQGLLYGIDASNPLCSSRRRSFCLQPRFSRRSLRVSASPCKDR
jgi:ABC-type antimicrobial peptide transport system permease subunit